MLPPHYSIQIRTVSIRVKTFLSKEEQFHSDKNSFQFYHGVVDGVNMFSLDFSTLHLILRSQDDGVLFPETNVGGYTSSYLGTTRAQEDGMVPGVTAGLQRG